MAPTLDRRTVLRTIFPDHHLFRFISGLAGSARDLAALTDDAAHSFCMGGVMGSASTIGLGMAIGAPDDEIVVVTGDGELQMNIGSLITIANSAPRNLTIICMDNEHHGETGNQPGHTSRRADLEGIARAAGFQATRTVRSAEDLAVIRAYIDTEPGPRFIAVKVMNGEPSVYKRLMDPAAVRLRFRIAFMNRKQQEAVQ